MQINDWCKIVNVIKQYLKTFVCQKNLKMLLTKCLQIIYSIYMYEEDLALNNLQRLICYKTQPNQIIYLIYMYEPDIGMMVRVFANGPSDLGSVPGWVISKTQKMVLDASFLNIIRYESRVRWSNPGKGVAHSPTLWCSSYQKREPLGHSRLQSPTLLIYVWRGFGIK